MSSKNIFFNHKKDLKFDVIGKLSKRLKEQLEVLGPKKIDGGYEFHRDDLVSVETIILKNLKKDEKEKFLVSKWLWDKCYLFLTMADIIKDREGKKEIEESDLKFVIKDIFGCTLKYGEEANIEIDRDFELTKAAEKLLKTYLGYLLSKLKDNEEDSFSKKMSRIEEKLRKNSKSVDIMLVDSLAYIYKKLSGKNTVDLVFAGMLLCPPEKITEFQNVCMNALKMQSSMMDTYTSARMDLVERLLKHSIGQIDKAFLLLLVTIVEYLEKFYSKSYNMQLRLFLLRKN